MKSVRCVTLASGLVSLLVLGAPGSGSAGPLPAIPAAVRMISGPDVERVAVVCGPYRCFRRPFWRYGPGTGFRPFQRFGFAPPRRFGFQPFGFERRPFGGGRFRGDRW